MPGPQYRIVITSDRYDLSFEEETVANITDLEIDLEASVVSSTEGLINLAQEADALLVSSREPVTREVISRLNRCKVISRYSVGIDHIDLDAATERGIVVTHVPDYCTDEVADHAFALILALNRRIVEIDRDLHEGAWVQRSYHTRQILRGPIPALRELTLGLIGIGRIGSAVARRAAPFGMKILAFDPHLTGRKVRESGALPASLDEIATSADIISIHCPLTPETNGMIGVDFLAQVKPSAVLVNTARGPIVQMEAIISAIADERLAGAALDVVDPEPLPRDSPLYDFANVILTPHAAYYSELSVVKVREEALDGVLRVLRGQFPRTIANPAVIDRVNLRPYFGS